MSESTMERRQLDVELGAAVLAARQTGRPNLVARMEELRSAWSAHKASQQQRESREAKMVREVERVDRAAARLALETERLRLLKEEAMDTVKRVEPDLVDINGLSIHPPAEGDRERFLAADLMSTHAALIGREEPTLTSLLARCGRRGSLGSVGSLATGLGLDNGRYPQNLREAWPAGGRDEGCGYYGAQSEYRQPEYRPSSRGLNHYNYKNQYGDGGRRQDYRAQSPEYRDEHDDYRDGGSQGVNRPQRRSEREAEYPVHYSNVRGGTGRRGKYERETSTDEGENTSNDAGDISSSGESGSGKRRRRGRQSPAPVPPPRQQRTQSAGPPPLPSPKQRQNNESSAKKSVDKFESPRVKDNSTRDKTTDNLKSVEDPSSPAEPIIAGKKNCPPSPTREVEPDANAQPDHLEAAKKEENYENSSNQPPPNPGQVVEDTSETSEATQPLAPEMKEVLRRASLDRERKVGLGVPTALLQTAEKTKTDAYQAMLAGARPTDQQTFTEESTSDDMEAEFAALAKPKSKLHSTGGGFHDEGGDPFAEETEECSPAPRGRGVSLEPAATAGLAGGGMGHMANLALSVGGGRGFGGSGLGPAVGRGGLLGGHGGLVGGRLAHPAAQKVGMMAVREIGNSTVYMTCGFAGGR